MYQNILFATDLGETDQAMAKQVGAFADRFKGTLALVHVIEPIPAYGVSEMVSPFIDQARTAMQEMGEAINVATDNQHIVFGSVKQEILKMAEEQSFDLIIIGSHGRHGLYGAKEDSS